MKAFVKKLLRSTGYSVQCIRDVPTPLLCDSNIRLFSFDDAVCRLMYDVGPSLVFMQIGVFDGITRDPLRKYIAAHNWRGVMVEPQSRAVGMLRRLYDGNPDIKILNAAIDSRSGQRMLYTVNRSELPGWVGGLASFDRGVVAKHAALIPRLEELIEEEAVTCVTFDRAIEQLPENRLDILQLDTEGADGVILSQFPFHRYNPAIIHFEIKHLNKREIEKTLGLLLPLGYRIARSGAEDMLAVLE